MTENVSSAALVSACELKCHFLVVQYWESHLIFLNPSFFEYKMGGSDGDSNTYFIR